jgi:hypothetical protein
VWAHKDLTPGRGSAGKPHAHMHNTCWPDTRSRGTEQQQHTGYTWPHKTREAGGGSGRGAGGLGAGHTYMNAWLHTHLYTRNSTQHCHTEGWQGGKGSKPKWKHSTKETENSTVCVHTPARNKTTHQVRDSPEGGEECVGCGGRHLCSAGEVPLQAPQSHGVWV